MSALRDIEGKLASHDRFLENTLTQQVGTSVAVDSVGGYSEPPTVPSSIFTQLDDLQKRVASLEVSNGPFLNGIFQSAWIPTVVFREIRTYQQRATLALNHWPALDETERIVEAVRGIISDGGYVDPAVQQCRYTLGYKDRLDVVYEFFSYTSVPWATIPEFQSQIWQLSDVVGPVSTDSKQGTLERASGWASPATSQVEVNVGVPGTVLDILWTAAELVATAASIAATDGLIGLVAAKITTKFPRVVRALESSGIASAQDIISKFQGEIKGAIRAQKRSSPIQRVAFDSSVVTETGDIEMLALTHLKSGLRGEWSGYPLPSFERTFRIDGARGRYYHNPVVIGSRPLREQDLSTGAFGSVLDLERTFSEHSESRILDYYRTLNEIQTGLFTSGYVRNTFGVSYNAHDTTMPAYSMDTAFADRGAATLLVMHFGLRSHVIAWYTGGSWVTSIEIA
jgi:hypothetical protein